MTKLEQRIEALSPAKRRLLDLRLQLKKRQNVAGPPPITRVARDRDLPLSFGQQRLWFLDQLEPNSAFYNVPRLLRIRGPLNLEVMRRCLKAFGQRHESARTIFPVVDGRPVQRILPALELAVPLVNLSHLRGPAREQEMLKLPTEESKRPFDLARGPLFRACLFRLADDDNLLLITTHHIITDEWTAGILYKELAILYDSFIQGKPSPLPELAIQFADYAVWQREWMQGEVLENQLCYWRKQLDGAPEMLDLPTDRPRPTAESFRGAIESQIFPPDLRDAVTEQSRRQNCTTFMVRLAAFALLLRNYTRQEDLVIGTVVSNRDRIETEQVAGFFLNSLPLRVTLTGDPSFTELLGRVRQVALEAYAHRDVPFEKLVAERRPGRAVGHNPLFQVLFTPRVSERPSFEVAGLTMQPLDVPIGTSKFDLAVFVGEARDGLTVMVEYNTDLFEAETIRRMLGHYRTLLRELVAFPQRPISQIAMLREQERHQILVEWNDTAQRYPLACVHEMFESQAARSPGAVAVTLGEHRLSYNQLNRRANQLAQHLRNQQVGPGSLVGICVERSLEMIVAVLGTLKAGAAYVPLDPDFPGDRLAFMLEDSAASVLLTQESLRDSLPSNTRVVCVDTLDTGAHSDQNFSSGVKLEDLVYVIFTSGSTGRPKGVCLPHRALSNLLFWQFENSRAAAGTRTLQFTSLSFDVSFQEIFSTLCMGGTLVLVEDSLRRDAAALLHYLRENQVNRLFLSFVALQNLAEAAGEEPVPETLSEVITAGEQLQITPQVSEFFRRLPGCTLHNHYGPSESHVVTAYTLSGPPQTWPALPPIGQPISNTQIYILSAGLQPVPVEVSGELYIAGTALATGYWKRPDLTAERFVPNPFQPGTWMYRTGDVARYRTDGEIEYLGRADDQVKIRGHRVEPGEIETVLHGHPDVAASAVTARDKQGGKYLAAYVVAKVPEGAGSLIPALRQYLNERLPEYMVPAAFVLLDHFPLTPSGKVNRHALPEPDLSRSDLTRYIAPRTPAEEILCAIWAEVLKVEKIGIYDDFFELGGHSLLATQVVSRIVQALDLKLPLRALFERRTIAELARYIESAGQAESEQEPPILPVSRDRDLPLSFAQQRLWLLSQLVGSSAAYNAPEVLRIRGPLDANLLERSINEVVRRHEVLRTLYRLSNDSPVQIVLPEVTVPLRTQDLSALPEADREAEANRLAQEDIRLPFDLAHGPVLRTLLLRLAAEDHVLALTFHHIVTDGWAMGIFDRELAVIYEALAEGRSAPLPELVVQYADYAAWQRDWMQGEVLDKHLEFWRTHLAGAPPMIDLPPDHARPSATCFAGARQYGHLPGELVEQLKSFSQRQGVTMFTAMLSAMQVLLSQWTKQRDLVVGTITASRTCIETENLIGCFMNFLPLRAVISENSTARDILQQAKRTVVQSFAHQDCPFEKLIEELNPERAASGTPLYNVIFVLQNFPEIAFSNRFFEGRMVPMGMEASHMDLRFAAGETSNDMWMVCDYRRDLFEPETIDRLLTSYRSTLEQFVESPQSKLEEFKIDPDLDKQAERSRRQNRKCKIAIAATFTAEPIEEPLRFWMNELAIPCEVQFAPFNQVFQQLLDPHSLLSRNQSGLNVVLVRLDDWWHTEAWESSLNFETARQRLLENVDQLLSGLREAVARFPEPYLLCLCPPWRETLASPRVAELFASTERRIADALRYDGLAASLTPSDLARLYPVSQYQDPHAYQLGRVPYTTEFFTALGTAIARRFYRIHTPPHKVIVLDYDSTLGRDHCSGSAASGVLEEFLVARSEAGMLLCLMSRSKEEDVWKMLEDPRGMLLDRDHFVSWRINSQPASENLNQLSDELQLGLDEFIFITGSPDESAEVDSRCPEVLSLELPADDRDLSSLLSHVWAFDQLEVVAGKSNQKRFQEERTPARAASPGVEGRKE